MKLDIMLKIKEDPRQLIFLRENSHWYKYLNRNSIYYKPFLDDLKEKYKLTTTDKINKVMDNINMITTFLDVLK